ncbi:hypothetical protein JCM8547_007894 [Rhodosporidiobolus lusitaniae]
MALSPKTATLFLVDCSASMGEVRSFLIGGQKTQRTGLDVAKQYVKAKIVQRMMRELKTTPFSVISFAHKNTKNVLTTRGKERAAENDEKFDKKSDPYRHCYELLPFTFSMDKTLLDRVDEMESGYASNGDGLTAIVLGLETLDSQSNVAKYPTKEIVVLTDGESEIDWDGVDSVANQLNRKGMSLTVIGMGFDDNTEDDFVEEGKSDIKRENEQHYRELIDKLEQPSIVANGSQAITAITTPQIKLTSSRADRMTLKLGDPEAHPGSAITMWVEVKKAVVPASAPTMKKMSMRGFEKVRTQAATAASQSQSQSQALRGTKRAAEADPGEEPDEDDLDQIKRQARFAEKQNREARAQMLAGEDVEMGNIGATFGKTLQNEGLTVSTDQDADLASHNVLTERRYFYRPPDKDKNDTGVAKITKKTNNGGETDEDEADLEAAAEEAEQEQWREVVDAQLTDAYHYGGSLVPVGDLEGEAGHLAGLQTGMEIVSFIKESDLRFDWRMGDVFYVYATPGQLGSEKLFSAFVNGMLEKRSVAVVRFVKKGFNSSKLGRLVVPDPQLGILFPKLADDEQTIEYCHWVRFPYSEDIRALTFPSLDRLFNHKGVRLTEHKYLPTEAQDAAMDALVDSMDLTTAGPEDEEANPTEFFLLADSYSPAIHNVQNTLVFRLVDPDGELPPVPRQLTKYMDPPQSVVEKSEKARKAVIDAFDIVLVPPKPRKINKHSGQVVQDDVVPTDLAALLGSQAADALAEGAHQAPSVSQAVAKMDVDRSDGTDGRGLSNGKSAKKEDEDEDEDFVIVDGEEANGAKMEDDEEEEAEPDTDEGEPGSDDEDEDGNVARESGPSLGAAFEEAEELVRTSFSYQNYGKAVGLIKAAKASADKGRNEAAFDSALEAFASKIRTSVPKKVDFLNHLHRGGIDLS